MTAIQRIRLAQTLIVFKHFAGIRLQRRSWQRHQQFGQMRATMHGPKSLFDGFRKATEQIQPNDLRIIRRNRLARAHKGRRIGARLGRQNVELIINGDAHRHLVHRLTRPDQP